MKIQREEIASKCHDIQTTLGTKQVPEFDILPRIGMMVSLSLHIRGLPIVSYDKFRLVSGYYFNIHPQALRGILLELAEIEFVKLDMAGETIRSVLPTVPYFESIYEKVGEYAEIKDVFNEPEELALQLLIRLSNSPTEKSNVYTLGADKPLVDRNLKIGEEGGYILNRKARGKEIILSPLFFSENVDVFTDLVAKSGSKNLERILTLIKKSQGWPLSLIEKDKAINGKRISDDDVKLLKRLAQDGVVKPPAINTPHAGNNFFIFTPAPGTSKLNPSKREIYERAMALVSATRQGQLLPKEYRIKQPLWILRALKRNGYLKPNTEALDQYQMLAIMKVGRLIETTSGWHQFVINDDAEENVQALDLAISILETGDISNMEINDDVRIALQKDQNYIESIIASSKLRETTTVSLNEEAKEELDNFLLKGISK